MNDTKEIELTGLVGSSPIGALAAFGLLRLCAGIEPLRAAKLGWRRHDDWVALLRVPEDVGKDDLLALLGARLAKQPLDMFTWSEDIRVDRQTYQNVLEISARKASVHDRHFCDYLAAFASESAVDQSKGLVKPTLFYMTSGQQRFLNSAREVDEACRDRPLDKLNEALFGPWLYRDKQHALGWDPAAERLYALRYKKPGEDAPTSVSAAVRLALEALPLFPVFPDKHGRLHTNGFVRKQQENAFYWPLICAPIGFDALRTLLTSRLDDEQALMSRGVSALYRAIRSEFGQGYGIFRPAQLVWQKCG